MTHVALLLAVLAQCPDGSPPPCSRQAAAPRAGSVAILYIAARDSADAYLADGLTEDVTTLLARRAGLAVKPSSTVRLAQRRQPDAAPRALGRTLAVRWVVQGSLRRAADRVRLNVQLVDAGSDVSVWGETYDRTAQGLLDLPVELANEIASRVGGVAVARAPAAPVWHTSNAAALDHFRRGNHLLASRTNFDEAVREYQEAARLDPRFASAVARSAYVLALRRNYGGPESTLTRGLQLADQALRLDSSNSDAWMALGYLRGLAYPKTLEGATEAFERAIALDSTNDEAWHQYGQVLSWLGDDANAARAVQRALQLQPGRAISLVDLAHYTWRDAPRALQLADSALALAPGLANAWRLRGFVHLRTRQAAEALMDADSLWRYMGDQNLAAPFQVQIIRSMAWVMMGDTARARAEMARRPGGWLGSDAIMTMAMGDTSAALAQLESIPPAQRNAQFWWWLRFPEFDALRANPRFVRIYQDARPPGARAP